ncbi:hypothetical protein ACWD6N_29910 [Micromonospora sp. NPDC005163]
MTATPLHLPLRPLWLCRARTAPWPCAGARLSLAREYAGSQVALCLYLSSVLHDAATDLHLLNPHEAPAPRQLFDRFIGWALVRSSADNSPQHPMPDEAPTALAYEGQLHTADGVGTEAT